LLKNLCSKLQPHWLRCSVDKHQYMLKQLIPAALACLLLTACKKENDNAAIDKPDHDCATVSAAHAGDSIEGQYIVAFSGSQSSASSRAVEQSAGDVLARNKINPQSLRQTFTGKLSGFIAKLAKEEAETLKKDVAVAMIEQDRIITLNHCFTVAAPRLITWNVNRVGYGDGRGKTAWVIDTGIDFDHPDLNVDAARSRSFIRSTNADDENGHGTHVAGIIGAKNNTFGVLGVASEATLVALKVLDKDGEGTLSAIVLALSYVNTHAKAGDVVNMSVGGEAASEILDQQVRNTAAQGIFIAIAAGNEGEPAGNYSPGRTNGANIYTVTAVDSLDRFASFSNYGNDVVDVAAPGVRILSCWINNRYAYASGTSMAAPHVAGLLLLKGNNISSSGTAKNDPDGVADVIAHY
jgi:subtilisin family serine protease